MEIPPVVNLEGHQFRTVLGSHKFSTQGSSSENVSTDHRGDHCFPEAQTCSLLEPDQDKTKLKKSFVSVGQNNNEFPEAVCFEEPGHVSVIPGGKPLDQSPLASAQLHKAGIVFTSPSSNEDCCGDFPLPVPVPERQSHQVAYNQAGQTEDSNCGCAKTEFQNLEPISNGHVYRNPGDQCSIPSLVSNPQLVVPTPVHDSGCKVLDLPCIVKHKLSSITFSDNTCSTGADGHAFANETSEDGESSPEEEDSHDDADDGDDDEVFPELPQSRELQVNSRHRRSCKDKQKRRGAVSARAETEHTVNNNGYEAEGETSNKESPWSESMSQLMRKLDQLNLDIEEALSASSSPSTTPCTTRKKQWGAVSKSTPNQTQKYQVLQIPSRGECPSPDGSPAPHSASMGTRTRSKKTMFNKMTNAAGAEIEAKEACDWLRAAGFPQYAQLFEDSQFPIDITPVKRDHDFLEKDLVEPLCRRLNTLNKCASMKLDVNLPKKKSEDSDEEDLFAISDKWTFEWSSRRWSRLQDIDCLLGNHREGLPFREGVPLRTTTSSESVLTDLSEPEVSSLHSESSGGSGHRGLSTEDSDCSNRTCSDSAAMPDSTSLTMPHIPKEIPHYGSLSDKHSKTSRTCAKDFLKRMETLRSRGTLGRGRKTLVISSPVLQQEAQALKTLHCVEIINGDGGAPEPLSNKVPPSQCGSEGSSHSSGSAVSTPSLKEHKPHRSDHKRSGMYLEDIDIFSDTQMNKVAEQNRKNEFCSYEDLVVHIPKDHKPGTFPKALSIESLSPTIGASINWHTGSMHLDSPLISCRKESRPVTQCCSRGSRISVYDNVPGSHLYASTGDLIDLEKEDLFPHLDDILLHVNGLQQIVDHWSQNVLPGGEGLAQMDGEREDTAGLQSSSQITLDFEGNSVTESQTTPSDGDRDRVSLAETESTRLRDRRDSGVGASLTRPNRLRWPSFQISNRLSHSVASLQITNQSAGQLSLLQKFSLLRLTAIMEKYSMSNKHGWTWSVPKFMKRMKVPDYKDKNVFGVPLIVHVQRSGQPLPLGLQQALRYLRSQCLDQVGLFRKSGVKSRIQALRQMNESSPDNVNYQDQSAYDVADMVKQFFRDLPEPLLTSKLGETFLHIYQYVPKDQRLQAVQAAIMLMSDENREVLQTLLCFLSDVTSSVEENQMTPMNIAVCLAPSLFHLNILKKDNLSPRAMQKKYATGRPDQKDLNENLAATQGLAHMIIECNRLFEIPHEMVTQSRNSYVEADLHAPTIDELCKQLEDDDGTHQTHMEGRLQNLLKEAREKSKYWVACSSSDNTELYYKKVGDGNPLRRWRVSVEVEAPPSVVLNRVLRERHLWDVDLLQWKVSETLDKQTEVFQYVLNRMPPHPSRDFVVLRSWRTDLPKGACSLVSVSIEHGDYPPVGGVRAIVLESNYLLEPCGSGKSRLTHICRVDLKGRTPDWYNKAFGHLCAAEAARIRNSFQPLITDGPETKI
ncbi:stAR-related lipid transfer protein 13 isoform X1 [Scophthalmus maximus]|uniref:stAR-related lipid transfer protein 13 isoform X1 n=2 Tax=Scophthalmus maximus TaxID=52904 RepID=UPI001FA94010|nr:stAR-related lipid transfer protein 13 isoform X1 [Scophthalmus maximus]XP_047191536.1 stAR-related lipid transfer protein 13 isoform X1 [Scophthalmus maximus]